MFTTWIHPAYTIYICVHHQTTNHKHMWSCIYTHPSRRIHLTSLPTLRGEWSAAIVSIWFLAGNRIHWRRVANPRMRTNGLPGWLRTYAVQIGARKTVYAAGQFPFISGAWLQVSQRPKRSWVVCWHLFNLLCSAVSVIGHWVMFCVPNESANYPPPPPNGSVVSNWLDGRGVAYIYFVWRPN